jgi:hypothetical protein
MWTLYDIIGQWAIQTRWTDSFALFSFASTVMVKLVAGRVLP